MLKVTRKQEAAQVDRVRRWRRRRDAPRTRSALDSLRATTERGQNVVPEVIQAIRSGATLGEISDVWRELFGEHRPSRAF